MTPQQILDAWTSMGPAGDRARVMRAIAEIEAAAREMGRDLELLQHREQWEDSNDVQTDPVKDVQKRLAESDETHFILTKLGELRTLLDRIFAPAGE